MPSASGQLDSALQSPFIHELHGEKQNPQDDEGSDVADPVR